MATEREKGEAECAVFEEFARLTRLPIAAGSLKKRPPPEPDLLCIIEPEGPVAFELVEICDPNLARAFATPRPNEGGVEYIRTSDPSHAIIRNKLRKHYATEHPIELLCYTAGRIGTPIDVIVPTVRPLLRSFRHTFRRAWLLSRGKVVTIWG